MKRHILVVDDESSIHAVLSEFLPRAGYEVTSAYTAQETYDVITDHPYDLMILDITLEGENGLEMLETVKQKCPDLPVIVYTGRGFDEQLLQEAMNHGAAGYASKTMAPNQLLIEIERVIQSHNS